MNAIQNSFIDNLYADNSYCPALRDVVTTPPEYLGKAVAVIDNIMLDVCDDPTVQTVAGYVVNNPVTRTIGSVLVKVNDAVESATGGVVNLPTAGAITMQHRSSIILGALGAVAAGQALFAAFRDEGLMAAGGLVGRGTLLALKTIIHLPIDILKFTFITLPTAAFHFLIKIPGNLVSIGLYLAQSKLVWATSPYIAAKISYNELCSEYEAEVSKTESSANFLVRMAEGYESKSNRNKRWLESKSTTAYVLAEYCKIKSKSREDFLSLLNKDKTKFSETEKKRGLAYYDFIHRDTSE